MKIKTRYEANGGKTMREVIDLNGFLYRRFNPLLPMWSLVWQEQIHTGEFHTIIDPASVEILEAQYQAALPTATPDLFVASTGGWVRAVAVNCPPDDTAGR